jgi:hypothetical protein
VIRATSLLALAAAAAVPFLQSRVDRALGDLHVADEHLYLWNGAQVKRLVPGFEHLAADVYWLRTVQYFGAERAFAAEKRFDLLYPLIDITTTLDPRLEIAYRYGAVFLAEPKPIGAGRPDLGIAVLERGVRNNPLSWRLHQELGFCSFVYLHDAKRAAEILVDASRIPGAAFWLKNLAAEILGKGGERDIARRMWREMYEQSEEGAIKENAKVHLQVLDAADGMDRLNAVVAEFGTRMGRRPRALSELSDAGLVPRRALLDPAGVPYEYDVSTGKVSVASTSYLRRDDLMGETR